jgi:hypothetical protein
MDINQELERLHKSFQINQECNAGDKSTDIIHLIARIHNSELGLFNAPVMDMSLKDEMTKSIYLEDQEIVVPRPTLFEDKMPAGESFGPDTSDDHGFIISDEIRPKFDLFKRFLADSGALEYWQNISLGDLRFFNCIKPNDWISYAFQYPAYEIASWCDLDKKWQEALAQIDAIVNQEIPKEEPWGRFIIPEEKKEVFEKFKLFLLERGCSDEFWEGSKGECDEFFEINDPRNWLSSVFYWSGSREGFDFWNAIDDKWEALCK